MTEGLERQCRIEANRCRATMANGTSPSFWIPRLEAAINRIDNARAILELVLNDARRLEEQKGGKG